MMVLMMIWLSWVLRSFLNANPVERIVINIYIAQGKEKHFKDYFRTNINQ